MVKSGRMWGDSMLMGEYSHNIDEKSRLIIPSKLRSELGSDPIITRGLDGCLFLYPKTRWDEIISNLNTLPFTKKDARTFLRFFMSGASIVTFDKQGRILIPAPLVTHSNITKECVIIGVSDRLEIWSKNNWEKSFNENLEQLEETAENLFQGISNV